MSAGSDGGTVSPFARAGGGVAGAESTAPFDAAATLGLMEPSADTGRPMDPSVLILESPLSRAQKFILALAALLSMLDGFEILSITFIAPLLAKELNVGDAALGLLLSSGPLGMLVGALTLAPAADAIGRRPVALISLGIMGVGMLASALCQTLPQLVAMRLFTGIGFGTMTVIANTIAVEFSSIKTRSLALSMTSVGFSVGGVIAGAVSALLMRSAGWQAVFFCGAAMAALLTLVAFARLPETLAYLLSRRDQNTVARVNKLLERLGHAPVAHLPPVQTEKKRQFVYGALFRGQQLAITIGVGVVWLFVYISNYYFLSWNPKMLVDLGFSPSAAAIIAGSSALAAACACIAFGLLSRRISGRLLAITSVFGLGVLVLAFGLAPPNRLVFILLTPACGAFMAIATIVLYVTAADAFEPRLRATGMGLMVGIGRAGAIAAPSVAGGLFALGGTRASVTALVALGVLVAGVVLLGLTRRLATP